MRKPVFGVSDTDPTVQLTGPVIYGSIFFKCPNMDFYDNYDCTLKFAGAVCWYAPCRLKNATFLYLGNERN